MLFSKETVCPWYKMPETPWIKNAFFLTLSCSVILGVIWLNNVISSIRYHIRLQDGTFEALGEKIPGFLPFLTWSAVDVTTVTTFIPFFGFSLIAINLLQMKKSDREDWPFFPGYSRLNIALGLIGTIWGIILIGYYPIEQIGIPALMQCLHTAMFSTLAAVIWIMVIVPLIISPWMKKMKRIENPTCHAPPDEEGDIDIVSLLREIHQVEVNVRQITECVSMFNQNLTAASKELQTLSASLHESRQSEIEWRTSAVDGMKAFSDALNIIRERQNSLEEENKKLKEHNEEMSKKLENSVAETEKFRSRIESLRSYLR